MLRVIDHGTGNKVQGTNDPSLDFTVEFMGNDNNLVIGGGCKLTGKVMFKRSGQSVHFAGKNRMNIIIAVLGEGGSVSIGVNSRSNGNLFFSVGEQGDAITIGKDCLFSSVKIRTSDSHSIIDNKTDERINPSRSIFVGDHVWLADEVLLLKGARIGAGTIVGSRSTVIGELPESSLCIGTPAKAIRHDVRWSEELT